MAVGRATSRDQYIYRSMATTVQIVPNMLLASEDIKQKQNERDLRKNYFTKHRLSLALRVTDKAGRWEVVEFSVR